MAELIRAESNFSRPNTMVQSLLLDSRQFSSAENVCFFALSGKNHDGHLFINELFQKGVYNFVVQQLPNGHYEGANFLVVPNTLVALQKLATSIRERSKAKVIGITGSNGKTIVKEWLAQVLQSSFEICRSPKSYNSQIGVPLSVWEMEEHHEIGIFEAGISKPGEMALLEKIIKPEIGIFTNIGTAHDQNFKDRDQKIEEKLQLFKHSQSLVYKKQTSALSEKIESFAVLHGVELLSWSEEDKDADLFIEAEEIGESGTRFTGRYKGNKQEVSIPFKDKASKENSLHCWRLALEMGIRSEDLQLAFSQLATIEMRLEMKSGSHGNLIINDAYNSDLESLKVALHFLENQGRKRKKVLILSDVLQSGLSNKEWSSQWMELIGHFGLDQVIGIGKQFVKSDLHLKTPFDVYSSTEEFLSNIYKYQFHESAILLKGARSFQFEKISTLLESKSHETVLNIHFDRMVHNLNYFRGLLSPKTKLMAMVKAFSYGSGSYQIANLLEFHKVDYLGVAYTDEGVELRKAGIALPIMVLNPEESSFDDLVQYQLEPEIFSLNQLRVFSKSVKDKQGDFAIHLKLETGLNRLGFIEEEIPTLLSHLAQQPQLQVASAFSHLAASDDPDEVEFTQLQIARLRKMTDHLSEKLGYSFLRHIVNSSGISQYPEAHFDMVRLGVGLYGVSGNASDRKDLKVVSELRATVSQIKHLKPGDSVSYGRTFVAESLTTTAVISIGYADGYRRSLSNGIGEVSIRGKRYSVIGKVCMDMIMINCTDGDVKVGDSVEIFGDDISIYELAKKMQTIPYEVLTGIGQRVKRVYFME